MHTIFRTAILTPPSQTITAYINVIYILRDLHDVNYGEKEMTPVPEESLHQLKAYFARREILTFSFVIIETSLTQVCIALGVLRQLGGRLKWMVLH